MRRTSSSIACAVTSDTCLCCVTLRPRNTSPWSSVYVSGPSLSDRPHFVTMLRAISVARSMSLDAPVVTDSAPKISLFGDAAAEQRARCELSMRRLLML